MKTKPVAPGPLLKLAWRNIWRQKKTQHPALDCNCLCYLNHNIPLGHDRRL